jgi:uncharacterized membrane protein YdjX (TVP38/TMEM64 family)
MGTFSAKVAKPSRVPASKGMPFMPLLPLREEKPSRGMSIASCCPPDSRLARVRGGAIKLLAGVLVLLMVASMGKLAVGGGAVPVFVMALNHVQQIGAWGVPLLIACEAIAFVLLVPISPLHVGMGFIYGPARGLLLAWFAYTIGCVPPFLLVRIPYLAERFTQVRRRMAVLDGVFSAVELEPFKLIVCLRLSPLLPSPLNSYLLGLTNVALRTYVLASLVGALPNICAYVYLGTLLTSLAEIASGRSRRRSPLTWALLITGGIATVGMIVYISRIATRRINAARSKTEGPTALEGGVPDTDLAKPPPNSTHSS